MDCWVRDSMFFGCWDVLNQVGWQNFTFAHVAKAYPQWDIGSISQQFPTKHHLVLAFSKKIPLKRSAFQLPKEGIFDSIMTRIDVLWPYRSVMGHSFLDMSLAMLRILARNLMHWFSVYWQSDVGILNPGILDPYGGLGNLEDAFEGIGMNIKEHLQYASFWSALSLTLYGAIFPYAMTHGYDDTLARLDRWINALFEWVEREVIAFF
jgi:hypothetical protein